MKVFIPSGAFLLISGCTLLPIDRENGGATIDFFKKSIECEVAAVANDPKYARFKLSGWLVKTGLDLTLVDTVSADGRATVPLVNPTLSNIFPNASINGKFTHNGHVDFATSVPKAIEHFGSTCYGPDPSQSRLGLANWISATLDQIEPQNHGGLSYTVDFDVTASAGARFGFVFSTINLVDAGLGYTREGVHHLVVTMSEPAPASLPLAVRIVGPVTVVESQSREEHSRASPSKERAPARAVKQPATRAPSTSPTRNPALQDPNLNRLLQQQAPVRLVPGQVIR